MSRTVLTLTAALLTAAHSSLAVEPPTRSGAQTSSSPFDAEYVDVERFLPPALSQPFERDFDRVTLQDFLGSVAAFTHTPVKPDVASLTDAGVTLDSEISAPLKGVPVYLGLRWVFENVNGIRLDWTIQQGTIVVSTSEYLNNEMTTVTEDIRDLRRNGYTNRALIELIEAALPAGIHWKRLDGEGGTLMVRDGKLIVRQTPPAIDEVRCLLQALRSKAPKAVPMRSPWDRKVEKALERKITCRFEDMPMDRIVGDLCNELKAPFHFDIQTLTDAGVSVNEKASLSVTRQPLKPALSTMLQNVSGVKLIAFARDGRLLITTDEAECERMITVVYHLPLLTKYESPESVIERLQNSTSEDILWQSRYGEGGQILSPRRQTLVVRQTRRGVEELESLMDAILMATDPRR